MSYRLMLCLTILALSTMQTAARGQANTMLLTSRLIPTATPCDSCGGGGCGQCTKEICVGKAEVVQEKKTCYEIECKTICVPKVRFPWEPGGNKLTLFGCFGKCSSGSTSCDSAGCDSCDSGGGCCDACGGGNCGSCLTCIAPSCGRVLKVRDLKKESYEVDVCEYSMEVEEVPACSGCSNGGCAAGGCSGGCAASGCAAGSVEMWQPSPVTPQPASPMPPLELQPAPAAAPQPVVAPSAKKPTRGHTIFTQFIKSR